jgi:methylated-DNA-[protein]-cysteine S-methyltransferase
MLTLHTKCVDGVWFGVACEGERVFATSFGFDKGKVLHSLLRSIPFNVPFQNSETITEFAEKIISSLTEIYNGRGCSQRFNLAIEPLSDYTREVLEAVAIIPLGYVASYGSVASTVGGSPRAVGRIMALNPFPLIIPCHRVVASDFSLGGYGGGLQVKLELLKRERRGYATEREISINNARMRVFPVEYVLEKALV